MHGSWMTERGPGTDLFVNKYPYIGYEQYSIHKIFNAKIN